MNFITHFLATWFDIIVGMSGLAILLLTLNYSFSAYVKRCDRKDEQAEMDRFKKAMNFTRQDMESKR